MINHLRRIRFESALLCLFYHSEWAYAPSREEAEEYAAYAAAARADLGEKVD